MAESPASQVPSSTSLGDSDGRWPRVALPDDDPPAVLAGCNKGYDENWHISTSMIKVYIAMRGGSVDAKDDLLRWIHRKESIARRNDAGQPS